MNVYRMWKLSVIPLLLLACGDDTPRGIQPNTDISQEEIDDQDTQPGGEIDAEEPGPGSDEAKNACDETRPCESGNCRSGICIDDPPEGAATTLSEPLHGELTDLLPDLSCADQSFEAPETSATADVVGALVRFGSGRLTVGMRVDFLRAEGFDASACEDLIDNDLEGAYACYREVGELLGSAVSVAAPEGGGEECESHADCVLGYECIDPHDLGGACQPQFGVYVVEDIPVDTPLIIRAYEDSANSRWHDTWMFNVILHSESVVDGAIRYDAQIVSDGQWNMTTNTVSLPTIAPEKGAIGGRVRDCADDRDSWPMGDVRLGLEEPGRRFVYFNDLEEDTVPLVDKRTTDIIGRFAALDVPAGWNKIGGAARVGGEIVSIGAVPVYVVPNALSIVSWPGTHPAWFQSWSHPSEGAQ